MCMRTMPGTVESHMIHTTVIKEILGRPYTHTHVHNYLLAAADDMAPCCAWGAGSVVVLFVCVCVGRYSDVMGV